MSESYSTSLPGLQMQILQYKKLYLLQRYAVTFWGGYGDTIKKDFDGACWAGFF